MKTTEGRRSRQFEYDVCLSFAGANRSYVRKVANALRARGIRVFFDEYEEAVLWGRDLYTHLDDVYQNAARYCVLFASRQYARKVWTNHERQSAQARAIREHSEYLLPARFDDTVIPGLRKTVHYIDLRRTTPTELADLVETKVGGRQLDNYFPPEPDRLFERLSVSTEAKKNEISETAHSFFSQLRRMTIEERHVLMSIFRHGCPTGLPDNIHVNLDYLRRVVDLPLAQCLRLLRSIRSLGVDAKIRKARRRDGEDLVVVRWHDARVGRVDPDPNATDVANAMVECALEGYCDECGTDRLVRLDFSQLAKATSGREKHASRMGRPTRHAPDDPANSKRRG